MGQRWKIYLPLALVIPGLAAWLGFRQEEQRLETGSAAPPLRTTLKRIFVRPPDSVARLNELRGLARGGELTSRESAECWQIIRGFDQAQVRSYLAELPVEYADRATDTLGGMLYARWGQLDPQSAADHLEEILAAPGGRGWTVAPVRTLLATWLARDPAAALQWAGIERKGNSNIISRIAGAMAGPLFVQQDPQTALERASREFPAALNSTMTALAVRGAASEENRQQFFDLTKNLPHDKGWKRATSALAWAWVESDPAGALSASRTESHGLTPEEQAAFRQSVLESVGNSKPALALDSLQPLPEDDSLRQHLYNSFAYTDPQEAADWALKNGLTDLLADQVKTRAYSVLAPSAFSERQMGGFRIQYQAWQQQQPGAAAKWLSGIPASLRQTLTSPATNAQR